MLTYLVFSLRFTIDVFFGAENQREYASFRESPTLKTLLLCLPSTLTDLPKCLPVTAESLRANGFRGMRFVNSAKYFCLGLKYFVA